MKRKKATVKVRGFNLVGAHNVKRGWIDPEWPTLVAVNNGKGDTPWTVYHAPTGTYVEFFRTCKEALEWVAWAAPAMRRFTPAWAARLLGA